MCMYIYIHTSMCIHICIYIYTSMYIYTHTHASICIYVYRYDLSMHSINYIRMYAWFMRIAMLQSIPCFSDPIRAWVFRPLSLTPVYLALEVRLIASVARAKVRILVLATGNSPSWIDPLWTSIVTQRRSEENRTKKEASLTTPFSITNKTNYIWLGYPHKISSVEDIPINQLYLVGGFSPSEKYEFVNWDDDIPQYDGKNKSHIPNHQPDMGLSERVYPQVATLIGKIITKSLTNPFMGYTYFQTTPSLGKL